MLTLEQRVAKLEAEINRLRGKQETWLSAREIISLTNRDKYWLARQRENRNIRYRENDKGSLEYLYESIPQIFLNQTA